MIGSDNIKLNTAGDIDIDPPCASRCQSVIQEAHSPFQMGKPRWVQCENRPTYIVREKRAPPGHDWPGAMSLCNSCRQVFIASQHAREMNARKRGIKPCEVLKLEDYAWYPIADRDLEQDHHWLHR